MGQVWQRFISTSSMALLGFSYTRKTARELDRIYGIQNHGSDFEVGLSREDADPRREYTLAELEDEFGAAIIKQYSSAMIWEALFK